MSSPTQKYVNAFAGAMEGQLDVPENRAKGDAEGWRADSPWSLLEAAKRNLAALEREMERRETGMDTTADILRRAVNTANFLMMVADVCGALPATAAEHPEVVAAVEMREAERATRRLDE